MTQQGVYQYSFKQPINLWNPKTLVYYNLHKGKSNCKNQLTQQVSFINILTVHQALRSYLSRYFICTKGKFKCTKQLTQKWAFIKWTLSNFQQPLSFEIVPQQALYLHKRQIQLHKSFDSKSELINILIAHQAFKLHNKYLICTKGKSNCTNQLTQHVSLSTF